jgi:O-antigen ligase
VLIGVLTVRPGGGVTLSDLVFLVSLVCAIGIFAAQRHHPAVGLPRLLLAGIVVFSIGGLISSYYAAAPVASVGVVIRVLYLAVWFWLGTRLLTEPQHLRTAIVLWVVSAAASGAGAIVQTVVGPVIPGAINEYGRVSGFTQHYNDLGGLTGIALVPALVAMHPRAGFGPLQRRIASVALAFIAAGLVLATSLSGILAAVLGGVVWTVTTRSYGRALLAVVLTVGATSLVAASGINPEYKSPLERLTTSTSTTSENGSDTFWTRVETYEAAWQEIRAHPLRGVGLMPEDTPTSTGLGVHNLLLKPLFEAGLIGALGMLAVYVATCLAAWRACVRARDESERLIAVALSCSVVGFIAWGMSQPVLFKRFGWIGGCLLFAVHARQLVAAKRTVPAARRASRRRRAPAQESGGSPSGLLPDAATVSPVVISVARIPSNGRPESL